MVAEIILVAFTPLPYLEGVKYYEWSDMYKMDIEYEINDILLCWSFLRIYILLRYFLIRSIFMTPRAKRVCVVNGCKADLLFATKAFMK